MPDNELTAIALKSEINANHRECLRAGNEAIHHAYQAGELLAKVKGLVPHGSFSGWVSQYCDFQPRTAQGYTKLFKDLKAIPKAQRVALLDTETSIAGLKKRPLRRRKLPPLLVLAIRANHRNRPLFLLRPTPSKTSRSQSHPRNNSPSGSSTEATGSSSTSSTSVRLFG
jgi:hypothetical protein